MKDLPVKELGNHHVVVFQDLLIKWPLVFPVPNQNCVIGKTVDRGVHPSV